MLMITSKTPSGMEIQCRLKEAEKEAKSPPAKSAANVHASARSQKQSPAPSVVIHPALAKEVQKNSSRSSSPKAKHSLLIR